MVDLPFVFATFVISGALGAFVILIVFRIIGVRFGFGKFVGAFLLAAILGVAVMFHLLQRAINANF